MSDPLRKIPSVDALLRSDAGKLAAREFGRSLLKASVREVLAQVRSSAASGAPRLTDHEILGRAAALASRVTRGPTPVINATGVVLHTGLGRAPLSEEAASAAARAATGYSDLEVDRETGTRSGRTARAEAALTALTSAEAALVVNNNAAALLLALAALARRKEVLVSRGELIEIGGEFRLPDIMAASTAKLVEVGTTNRTRLSDYRSALSAKTALVMKVHPSNFRVVGFYQAPSTRELAGLAREAGVPLLYDLGSGLVDRYPGVPDDEPAATEALAQGADLACFSGDKLLGGPQAGIVVGRADLVERLRRHPIARAVRVDKMQIAALGSVLAEYSKGEQSELPSWQMLRESSAEVGKRAEALARTIRDSSAGVRVVECESAAGGGSLPGFTLPSFAVRLETADPGKLAARLRTGDPPVFCRTDDGAVLLDMRTVPPEEVETLARAVSGAVGDGRR